MKVFIFLTSFSLIYFVYGFYISQNDISIVNPSLKIKNNALFYDYKGILNVHSNLSIGSSPITQIIKSAQLSKLDFIMFTDLNYFNPPYGFEGYHDHTLVLIGQKISYLDSRFIVYSLSKEPLGNSLGEAQIKIADLLSQKENKDHLIILAHPSEKGFIWNGELPSGIDGIELINLKSLTNKSWASSKLSTIWSLLIYPFNNGLAFGRIFNEPTDELNLFDANLHSHFFGYAGSEASARTIPIANYLIKFPSYQRTFDIFSTHVVLRSELTGNSKTDRAKIFQALKNGNFYLAFDLLGNSTGFLCYLEDLTKNFSIGSKVKKNKNLVLKIKLPTKPLHFFEIVIYRNGQRYATYNDDSVEFPIRESGTYRVQVRVSPYLPLPDARTWISWIYTNPFYVID
ncbi:MAG: hypothetical protein J0M15_00785 [Deltaproteobacteria bacterium]|jgi:hypothetical protein|nr:hypothetical protein [Deltaproteobacteria bacterium]